MPTPTLLRVRCLEASTRYQSPRGSKVGKPSPWAAGVGFFLSSFLNAPRGSGILVPSPGIEATPPAVGAQILSPGLPGKPMLWLCSPCIQVTQMCSCLLDDRPDENPDYLPPPSPGAP